MTIDDDKFLSIWAASKALGVSKRTINNYFNKGLLSRWVQSGPDRAVWVLRSEVEALLAKRNVPPQRQPRHQPGGQSSTGLR